MADWSQEVVIEAEPLESPTYQTENAERVQFEDLSPTGQRVVRAAVESGQPQRRYGYDDVPDQFVYSDYEAVYVVDYEGQQYVVTTSGAGGFPFVYWLYELPFVIYGILIGWIGAGVTAGRFSTRLAHTVGAGGLGIHLLGPEFDFPLVGPDAFVGLGVLAALVTAAWLVHLRFADHESPAVTRS
ncbi:hypothetical protein BRD10_03000 [Halobacteriales archaeon SW_12_71_31]|nr:MAG: hypothetical protein BRD10_03000 [Halobacteriales archaeon SW_12_71_31]